MLVLPNLLIFDTFPTQISWWYERHSENKAYYFYQDIYNGNQIYIYQGYIPHKT
jgi:hypothetical protein